MGTKAIAGASGRHGSFTFSASAGGTILCVTNFELTEFAQEEETTNSCSAGARENEYGLKWVEGVIEADLDLSKHPFGDPPGMIPGQSLFNVSFLEFSSDGVSRVSESGQWQFSEISIVSANVTCPASGKVTYSFQFKSNGSYEIGVS